MTKDTPVPAINLLSSVPAVVSSLLTFKPLAAFAALVALAAAAVALAAASVADVAALVAEVAA